MDKELINSFYLIIFVNSSLLISSSNQNNTSVDWIKFISVGEIYVEIFSIIKTMKENVINIYFLRYACMRARVCVCVGLCACTRARACMRVPESACARACVHWYVRARVRTCMHACVCLCVRTCMHAVSCMRASVCICLSGGLSVCACGGACRFFCVPHTNTHTCTNLIK